MTNNEDKNLENELKNDDISDIETMLEDDIRDAEKAEEEIEKEIKELNKVSQEVDILKDSLARAQADYQNLIKRVERDKKDLGTYLTSSVLGKILPFIDNIERLIDGTKKEDKKEYPLLEGLKSTLVGLQKTLEDFDVKPFKSIGEEVNPDFHEVLTQTKGKEGIIVEEFEKGYMIGEKVLRHSKVIVGNGEE